MGCFVVTEFLLTTASRSPSAIAEPLVFFESTNVHVYSALQAFRLTYALGIYKYYIHD